MMTDYKELIVHIATVMALEDECGQKELADMLEKAADAIEQLVKERDAAVADLTVDKNCDFCTWQVNGECIDYEYEECTGEHWEWRGVQEVSE